MRRRVIDFIDRAILWSKRNQWKKLPTDDAVKINIGSGLAVAQGWINVDASVTALVARWPKSIVAWTYRFTSVRKWYSSDEYQRLLQSHCFVHHDLRYGLPFADNSADHLYSSHCLEHFFRDEAEELLREIYRVLKSGGRLRIVIPDLGRAMELYAHGRKTESLDFFFPRSRGHHHPDHHYSYDFDLLRDLLVEVGFRSVERCEFRKGTTPDLERLDNRPESLFVEAVK